VTDVVVQRCVLHIRRTGGWARGAPSDPLVAAATRALPQLIGARLPAIAARLAKPVQVARPVEVRIAMTVSQLAALADGATAAELRDRIADTVAAAVDRAIDRAIDHAIDPDGAAAPGASLSRAGSAVTAMADEVTGPASRRAWRAAGGADDRAAGRAWPAAPAAGAGSATSELAAAGFDAADQAAARRAVRAWWRAGCLAAVLDCIEPGALAWLHDRLLGESIAAARPAPELVAAAEHAAERADAWLAGPARSLQRRIALAAAALANAEPAADPHADPAGDPASIPAARRPDDRATRDSATQARAPGERGPGRARAPAVLAPLPTGELEIRSVLPFLLLSPLRHAGWLDGAAALLAAHGCAHAAFALAAGLAAKVLDPLDPAGPRGWRRSGPDRIAIAVFAGRGEPIADAETRAAAAELFPLLGALDTGLRALLARARAPRPQVLWRDARGWLLVDADGMVAIAAAPDLQRVVAAAHAAPIVVPAACADAATFDQLDYANRHFISDAPPTRGEAWRSFAGVTRRLYTNDTATPVGELVAATADLDHTLALVAELAELVAARPVIPRDPVTAFEATCTLAATAALADIAARLFPAEPTTPALVLARFRDLDARVAFDADRISVRFPLGRRHADLLRHGLVGEFSGIPWLGGRTLDLAGG